MSSWVRPQFTELQMNAEIGAYQPEPGDDREVPPVLDPELAVSASLQPVSLAAFHAAE
jgi:hypothetical protein